MSSADVGAILAERAALGRRLAELDDRLAVALCGVERPDQPDAVLTLAEAASYAHEPTSTFRQRSCYRAALVSGPREKRLRFSRAALDRVMAERLARVRP